MWRSYLLQQKKRYNTLGDLNDRLISRIKNRIKVSLHIRRGDYLGLSAYYNLTETTYYDRAIKYISDKFDSPIFVVFSDDIPWVKENLTIIGDREYVDWNIGQESYKDMILMSMCDHNINANSSFSYWGAMLNENPDKIVIAPKFWDKGRKTNDLVYPPSWIVLDL